MFDYEVKFTYDQHATIVSVFADSFDSAYKAARELLDRNGDDFGEPIEINIKVVGEVA